MDNSLVQGCVPSHCSHDAESRNLGPIFLSIAVYSLVIACLLAVVLGVLLADPVAQQLPEVGHELGLLRFLDLPEVVQDGVAHQLGQRVHHRLDRPDRRVGLLRLPVGSGVRPEEGSGLCK